MPAHTLQQEFDALRQRLGMGGSGATRVVLLHGIVLAIFGVWLPWRKGLDFFDPAMISAYACLGVVFAPPAAAQGFDGHPPGSMRRAMARIFACLLYGETMAVAMLVAGVATVDATHGWRLLLPELDAMAVSVALGVAASLVLSEAAAWIALRFSVRAARGALRVAFLAMLVGFFLAPRRLPEIAGSAAILCLAMAALLILLLRREVASALRRLAPAGEAPQ